MRRPLSRPRNLRAGSCPDARIPLQPLLCGGQQQGPAHLELVVQALHGEPPAAPHRNHECFPPRVLATGCDVCEAVLDGARIVAVLTNRCALRPRPGTRSSSPRPATRRTTTTSPAPTTAATRSGRARPPYCKVASSRSEACIAGSNGLQHLAGGGTLYSCARARATRCCSGQGARAGA